MAGLVFELVSVIAEKFGFNRMRLSLDLLRVGHPASECKADKSDSFSELFFTAAADLVADTGRQPNLHILASRGPEIFEGLNESRCGEIATVVHEFDEAGSRSLADLIFESLVNHFQVARIEISKIDSAARVVTGSENELILAPATNWAADIDSYGRLQSSTSNK